MSSFPWIPSGGEKSMKIKSVSISNFRGYKSKTNIDFNDLTVFVGENDIGKSTILEALDLFFNDGKGIIKFDEADLHIPSDETEFQIGVSFVELPEQVAVLSDEYLLNEHGILEVIKKFNGSKCTNTSIRASHPTNPNCEGLLLKKRDELKSIIQRQSIKCENVNMNSAMRRAIWNEYWDDLQLKTLDIDVTEEGDAKKIWAKLSTFLPQYSLFKSDRQNSDGDKEVQDPLKAAVAQFFQDAELQQTLNEIAKQVEVRLKEVAERTLAKLKEMDPNVAESLKPHIPSASSLKWADVFKKVSITGDEDIPINKRGSGVKRLILLNFFRAEAERRQQEDGSTGVIYAIEEPETSQHFKNQKILADALIALSHAPNTQVILTTHSGVVVKRLSDEKQSLRLISENEKGEKCVSSVQSGLLGYVSLNEVNYTAFGEATEEYHNELYGYLVEQKLLEAYESEKPKITYTYIDKKDQKEKKKKSSITRTKYIRHQIHHPENKINDRYTYDQLCQSISEMREFIFQESRKGRIKNN